LSYKTGHCRAKISKAIGSYTVAFQQARNATTMDEKATPHLSVLSWCHDGDLGIARKQDVLPWGEEAWSIPAKP
jgi:hypothetical protein